MYMTQYGNETSNMYSLPNETQLKQFNNAYIQNITYEDINIPDKDGTYDDSYEENKLTVKIYTTAGILQFIMTNEQNMSPYCEYWCHDCIILYNIMTTDNKLLNNRETIYL